jgi:hypothetical protein
MTENEQRVLARGVAALPIVLALVLILTGALALAGCGRADEPSANAAPAAASPSADPTQLAVYVATQRARRPSDAVMAVLEGRIAAMNRGEGEAAAAYYAASGVLEETDLDPDLVTRGREAIATRLGDLYDMGLRLKPAGAPIQYDIYVAEPVKFINANGPGKGAGMLVFEFNPRNEIAYQWVIGWVD